MKIDDDLYDNSVVFELKDNCKYPNHYMNLDIYKMRRALKLYFKELVDNAPVEDVIINYFKKIYGDKCDSEGL